jgi:hypothetical protein
MCDGPVSMTECAVYVVNHLIASYCDTLTLKPPHSPVVSCRQHRLVHTITRQNLHLLLLCHTS